MNDQNKAEAMADEVTTVEIGRDKYRTLVRSRGHEYVADEPGAMGGADLGPSPFELLLASLGACKVITVRMYADRKGWDLESVRMDLAHSRPEGRDKPERIEVSITLRGDLDEDQRGRLKEIAEKCPVQRTITGELTVESVLEE